ncbi:hypothetical protein [Mycobacterium sp. Z3061]|uniref:hypothetical protein n=1 Tax=Mycobacterium sp. Z3061 TaxID=3073562 RepID=UPI0028739750|nr:hypothetical protein [Mycobacterium sp. Z3061]
MAETMKQFVRAVTRRQFIFSVSGALGAVLIGGCAADGNRGSRTENSMGDTTTSPTTTSPTTTSPTTIKPTTTSPTTTKPTTTNPTTTSPTTTPKRYACRCTGLHDYEWQDPDFPEALVQCPRCGETSTIIKNPIPNSNLANYTHRLCPKNPVSWTGSTKGSKCPVDPSHTSVNCTAS